MSIDSNDFKEFKLVVASTVNGFIDTHSKNVRWSSEDKNYLIQCLKESTCVVIGRSTYNQMLKGDTAKLFPPDTLVLDSTLDPLKELMKFRGRKILFLGGSELNHFMLQHKIVSDLVLDVEPRLFHGGFPMIQQQNLDFSYMLELKSVAKYSDNGLRVHYKILY
jgi:dihydrofolate reductase